MNQDLPFPDGDPGLDQLFRTLTSDPTRGELADQDAALAMFRANIKPPNTSAAGSSATRTFERGTSRRWFRLSFSPGLAIAAAMVVALGGGVAAAAYTDALPAPVQGIVHDVFRFAGVPSERHHHSTAGSKGRGQHQGGRTPGNSAGGPSHGASGKPAPTGSHKSSPSPSHSPSHSPSPSPAPSGAAGAALTASVSSPITAGGSVTIDGHLTRSGSGVAGITIKLAEHLAGTAGWQVVGSEKTTASGDVAVTVSALTTNAGFQLRAGDGVHSAVVRVVVTPAITITLKPGALALRDLLSVATQFAHLGNWVELQADEDGVWTTLREKRLNAAGATHFYLSGKNLKGDEVQVVLLATLRHGAATSNQVTVPAPS
jgi:hypothetical protein